MSPHHHMELRVLRSRKVSNTGVIAAGGQAPRHQLISLRLKGLQHILREGTGRDQRCLDSELREQEQKPQERRLLTQGWREVLEKTDP